MKTDLFLHREELQILLNHLGAGFTISYPPYPFPLVTFRIEGEEYRFRLETTREQMTAARDPFEELSSEIPDFDDLFSCLMHAGMVPYANREEFDRVSKAYKGLKKDIFYVLDTNLLYHGFPTRSGIDPAHFVILDIIPAEIEGLLNNKYRPSQISGLKTKALFRKQLFDELSNQRTRRSRLATYLALREYQMLRDRALRFLTGKTISTDKEENDLLIVRALRQFETEKASLPVLLTADKNVATLCEAEGVEYFLFVVPYVISRNRCTPAEVVRLIFDLATVFGFIQCGGVYVFGEFRGKGPDLDDLKVTFLSGHTGEEILRDLEICRKLMSLSIEQ